MKRLIPVNDTMIIREIESETKTASGLILSTGSVEASVRGVVVIPNTLSYHRGGELRQPLVSAGDIVVMQSAHSATEVSDAPDGERWLAVSEDCILYIVKGVSDGKD
ncbi:chaperonin 10 Kd subunit [Vibrio phage 1.083.O._10N.286.52.B9]|nr:chaperonin 10 Kd subunit [Vibrio phage 1.083.O._10N.286.52.B9]